MVVTAAGEADPHVVDSSTHHVRVGDHESAPDDEATAGGCPAARADLHRHHARQHRSATERRGGAHLLRLRRALRLRRRARPRRRRSRPRADALATPTPACVAGAAWARGDDGGERVARGAGGAPPRSGRRCRRRVDRPRGGPSRSAAGRHGAPVRHRPVAVPHVSRRGRRAAEHARRGHGSRPVNRSDARAASARPPGRQRRTTR